MTTNTTNAATTVSPLTRLSRQTVNRLYEKGACSPIADHRFTLGEAWVCTTPDTFDYPGREDRMAVLVRLAE